jgi:hypothetical protein
LPHLHFLFQLFTCSFGGVAASMTSWDSVMPTLPFLEAPYMDHHHKENFSLLTFLMVAMTCATDDDDCCCCGTVCWIVTGVAVAAILLLTMTVTLIAVSIKVVENDELALVYNNVSREFDHNQVPLQQGRYAVAVCRHTVFFLLISLQTGEDFFRFPRVFILQVTSLISPYSY